MRRFAPFVLSALLLVCGPFGGMISSHPPAQAAYGLHGHDLSILGAPVATKEQCAAFLTSVNPLPHISVTVEELVDLYYEEGISEGVRPDVAFAQALLETGYFRYGGDIQPHQNNYAGIGATGYRARGAEFHSSQTGVRSHIQHLLAYATTRRPSVTVVDPRYDIVAGDADKHGKVTTWLELSGKWAVPGVNYGDKILSIHRRIVSASAE